MEYHILHLYPEQMSLYGEYANLAVLRRHLEAIGVTVTVDSATGDSPLSFEGCDLIYMGAGTERGQKAVLPSLLAAGTDLKDAISSGCQLFFTGNAMELLGTSVTDADGRVYDCLGVAPFVSKESSRRILGDVIAKSSLLKEEAVGFMNKCSTTAGVDSPLFEALSLGFGNEAKGGAEGYVSDSILATHLSGPVLVKNPELLDLMLRRCSAAKGWTLPDSLPRLPHEREAYENTLRCLQERIGKE